MKKAYIGGIVAAVVVVGGVIGGRQILSHAAQNNEVIVGVVGDSSRELWEDLAKRAAKQDIKITVKTFNDYVKPNQALTDGSLDLNAFQTRIFFDDQNKKMGSKMTPIGNTVIVPMRMYSLQYHKIADIPANGTIAVPNDATNEQRALDVLEQAKLITYNHKVDNPTARYIIKNPKHLSIKEVDSAQTVSALKGADAAVINGNFAHDAKLSKDNVLISQDLTKNIKPYINIIAAQKKDANKKIYRQIVKLYQTKETAKDINRIFGDSEAPIWDAK